MRYDHENENEYGHQRHEGGALVGLNASDHLSHSRSMPEFDTVSNISR
jgi:hypothetical protein